MSKRKRQQNQSVKLLKLKTGNFSSCAFQDLFTSRSLRWPEKRCKKKSGLWNSGQTLAQKIFSGQMFGLEKLFCVFLACTALPHPTVTHLVVFTLFLLLYPLFPIFPLFFVLFFFYLLLFPFSSSGLVHPLPKHILLSLPSFNPLNFLFLIPCFVFFLQ